MLVPDGQKFVTDNGIQIACDEQQEFTTHTEEFDAQVDVLLSHNSKIEHEIPGAQ